MRFRVSRSSTLIVDGNVVDNIGHLVVDVERWWDARTVALMHFACEVEELRFEQTTDDADVDTRWVGNDIGDYNRRRMEFRVPQGEWRPIGEYHDHLLAVAEVARFAAEDDTEPETQQP